MICQDEPRTPDANVFPVATFVRSVCNDTFHGSSVLIVDVLESLRRLNALLFHFIALWLSLVGMSGRR